MHFFLVGSMLLLIGTDIVQQYKGVFLFVIIEFNCMVVCMTKAGSALL